ncbi:poly(ADP-ribose) glycohydrolase 1-like [Coffea eugenioides]|uniref:poly(ADP-ribose) glycohydrolase 1-like n=1 Tax=Coffea eugenioides TaxID=49369 RepID=UPI000F60DB0B|nr:poly(ADP-ribose) glycohydrolase 1-like [Coffea eugenioides]
MENDTSTEKKKKKNSHGGEGELESEDDLKSILPYLPLHLCSSSLFWPPPVVVALKALSLGPHHSNVRSGQLLSLAISDLRSSLNYSSTSLSSSALHGYSLFFDDLMPRADSVRWFEEVLPKMALLLLNLPSLLETHYRRHQQQQQPLDSNTTCLRLLDSQQPGLVLLSQELIAALLSCAFFSLFPAANRGATCLPTINFHHLFASLYGCYEEYQESKIKCIVHYFERICLCMPTGNVSFERKVLPLDRRAVGISYPKPDFWNKSDLPLCPFEVQRSGLIEDQVREALEVDFANQYLGGGALHRGCVQEEIRFMINPELVAGMLFLPSMADNEAIEVVGTERFSNYTGYASSFRFSGDYVDHKDTDSLGRRKTRIIAIDALCSPGMRQYGSECLLREINKAFCGFCDMSKYQQYQDLFQYDEHWESDVDFDVKKLREQLRNDAMTLEGPSTSYQITEGAPENQLNQCLHKKAFQPSQHQEEIGIVTGNWGCGAFGGDPQLKAIIQWLAASQALRPFILYHTFGLETLEVLDQVTRWIISHEWTVGELWNMMVEYGSKRLKGETRVGFFSWLLPLVDSNDA